MSSFLLISPAVGPGSASAATMDAVNNNNNNVAERNNESDDGGVVTSSRSSVDRIAERIRKKQEAVVSEADKTATTLVANTSPTPVCATMNSNNAIAVSSGSILTMPAGVSFQSAILLLPMMGGGGGGSQVTGNNISIQGGAVNLINIQSTAGGQTNISSAALNCRQSQQQMVVSAMDSNSKPGVVVEEVIDISQEDDSQPGSGSGHAMDTDVANHTPIMLPSIGAGSNLSPSSTPMEDADGYDEETLICARQELVDGKFRVTDTGPESKHTCGQCNVVFKSNIGLSRHERDHHGRMPFRCGDCGKAFASSTGLTDHRKRVHAPRPFACAVCNQCFSTEYYLRAHVRIHEPERPHLCTECGKTFVNKTDLRNHMRVHTGDRPYQCSVCDKAFRHVSGFYTHVRIHTGETPYECEFCGKSFTNASNFQTHRKIHTKEKQFSCEFCGREFIQQSNYSRHKRLHTGERPYRCEAEGCDKTFIYSTALKRHQVEHGIRAIPCPSCSRTFLNPQSYDRHRTGCTLKNVVQEQAELDSSQYL